MPKNNINLQLIIEGCRKDNRNSQRILFEHYMGYAMKICLRYASNKEEAEEILNNGFLKIFRHINTYDDAYPFQNWLHQVITNAAIDHYRANQKKITFLELDSAVNVESESMPMPTIFPEENVLPILQKLPPTYRLVFNLSIMEGYKHEEIAAMLGITASTSRSNLSRAKEKLRELLTKKNNLKNAFLKGVLKS